MPKGICYNASRQERRKCSLWHAKSPGVATSGAFLFRCGKVAYALGWLPPIYLRPAICRCSRRLHLPRQRVRKTKTWNYRRLCAFLHRVQQFLFKAVNRRGCRRAYTWGGFWEMLKCYPLAKPKTYYCLY